MHYSSFLSLSLLKSLSLYHSSIPLIAEMKWPKNTSSAASTSLINRLFRVPWFSKSSKKPAPIPRFSKEGRFYSMDEDDAFWRLSFRDDGERRRSTGGINPLWCDDDPDHEDSDFNVTMDGRNFNEMVSDIKKLKLKRSGPQKNEISSELENVFERDVFPVETEEIRIKPKNRSRGVLKPHSPRTECRIRALEEMKKARTKTKKKKEKVLECSTVFDSFAVAKSSSDPARDFRDSMVEMIRERGIGHPRDLEQLLACYLTLNCDEYHGLIIKVFRQVWFELYFDPVMQNGL